MAPTLTELRVAVAAALSAALTDVQVSPYMLANPTPPSFHVYPADVEYDLAMARGLDRWELLVQGFAGLNSDIGTQELLDQFIAPSGPQSVKAAVEADITLGGLVDNARVTTCSGYQVYARDNGGTVLGAEWRVEIYATGE